MALPKTYLDILLNVSVVKVTVTVGTLVVLLANTEIGIVAFLGAKSSKKQFVFCANSEIADIITMPRVKVILCFILFINKLFHSNRLFPFQQIEMIINAEL